MFCRVVGKPDIPLSPQFGRYRLEVHALLLELLLQAFPEGSG